MDGTGGTAAFAVRPRGFVSVRGPEAVDYLNRMVSNDVAALAPGDSCEALLLTPKARVIAPLRVLRRDADDLLILTEPELADVVRSALVRARFAARCEIELEEHSSHVVIGNWQPPAGSLWLATSDYGEPAIEVVGSPPPALPELAANELERRRIAAATPAWGREIDERVLPAEAGLVERAVSFTKGCYPGQEPIARLHYRGHANRALRRLRLEGARPPARDAEIRAGGAVVGRLTSAIADGDGVAALGYVRAEVAPDAELEVDGSRAWIADPIPG